MQALTAYLCPYRTPSYCGWTRPFSVCFEKIYFFKITTHLQRLQNYHTSPWILNPVLQCDLTDLFVNGPSSHSAKIKYCSTGGAVGTCIHISLVNVLAVEWNTSMTLRKEMLAVFHESGTSCLYDFKCKFDESRGNKDHGQKGWICKKIKH